MNYKVWPEYYFAYARIIAADSKHEAILKFIGVCNRADWPNNQEAYFYVVENTDEGQKAERHKITKTFDIESVA